MSDRKHVDAFVALATHLVRRAQPDLLAPGERPATLDQLVTRSEKGSWATRSRLAAFLSDLPPLVRESLSTEEAKALERVPARLGASTELMQEIAAYNKVAPEYREVRLDDLRNDRDSKSELFSRMAEIRDRLGMTADRPLERALDLARLTHLGPHGGPPASDPGLAAGCDLTPSGRNGRESKWIAILRDSIANSAFIGRDGALLAAGVTPSSAHACSLSSRYEVDGSAITVSLFPIIQAPFNAMRWLLDPSTWSSCITQVNYVAVRNQLPDGTRLMHESINLLGPVKLASQLATVECDLLVRIGDVETSDGCRSQLMTFELAQDGSELLDQNAGSIRITELERRGTACALELTKTIHFKTETIWKRTFDANPDGLSQMINYWVVDAEKHCGPA